MSTIDATYFNGENQLANLDQPAVIEKLQLYIDEYEPEFLKLLLGATLYAQYVVGITPVEVEPATDPVTYLPIDVKWTALKNAIYVITGTAKVSPVANYIYFYFVRRSSFENSGIGFGRSTGENFTALDPMVETSRAWNKMNKLSFEVYKFLKANEATYGPLPYCLRFREGWYNWDWSYWYGWFPRLWRCRVPEIYLPINANGI